LSLTNIHGPGTDCTENVSFIISFSLAAGETACPQSCYLVTAVVLSPVYTIVTWKWVYMSQYFRHNENWMQSFQDMGELARIFFGLVMNCIVPWSSFFSAVGRATVLILL
jgi:hypothetical protein